MTASILGPIGIKAIEGRGISAETAVRLGLYTVRRGDDGISVPDPAGNVVVFPFMEGGRIVNEKFRAPNKVFWQTKGGRKTFYNADVLDDPGLETGAYPLIITEGEIDAITAIDCGFPLAVSVPDGAPPPAKGAASGKLPPLDPEEERQGKFEYLWNNRDRLKRIKRFILAVDNDAPGKVLAAELVRRLGAARCMFVSYPDGCKDLNDVLMKAGAEAVASVLNSARHYPVRGLYRLSDYPQLEPIEGVSTGWPLLDGKTEGGGYLRLFPGEFMVVTGIPSHGKALALDTPIPTASGWTTMGQVECGDTLFDENGDVCQVTKVSNVMSGRPCYRIVFDDNTEIIADADHQWLTVSEKARRSALLAKTRGNRRAPKLRGTDQRHKRTFASVVTTAEIASSLWSQGKRNHHVKLPMPFKGISSVLPINPYVLGAWLGDGTSANGSLTCFDTPILDCMVANGETVKAWNTPGRYNIVDLKPKLRKLGLLENKHVPILYQRASVDQRLALLRGLMDTDGSCRPKDKVCEFTSVNKRLAEDVRELAAGLGIKATILVGDATLHGRVICPKYRVCFLADFPVFTLGRKIAAQRIGDNRRTKDRIVVACDSIQSVPVRCIEVDSPSHLYLATKSFIPTHNSTWVLNLLVNLARMQRWRSAVFSPEMPAVPFLRDKLRRIIGGPIAQADDFIEASFTFIDSDPTGQTDDDMTIEWLLEKATDAVLRDGVRVLVIDPWNEIEIARQRGESTTEYIGRSIRALKRFARQFEVAVIVIAHPTKEINTDKGVARTPSLYDIEGSAHWANKADHGIVIDRPDPNIAETKIIIAKVRHDNTGEKGAVRMRFDQRTCRYSQLDEMF